MFVVLSCCLRWCRFECFGKSRLDRCKPYRCYVQLHAMSASHRLQSDREMSFAKSEWFAKLFSGAHFQAVPDFERFLTESDSEVVMIGFGKWYRCRRVRSSLTECQLQYLYLPEN